MVEKELLVALATDMETGIQGEVIFPEYFYDNFEGGYKANDYVGSTFEIKKETVQGKRWRKYTIIKGEWS